MHPSVLWLVVGLALLIIELFTMTFFLMWVGAGALLAAASALLTPAPWVHWLVFFVASIVLLLATRPLARSIHGRVTVPSNVDSLVGQTAVVLEAIDPIANTGRVRIGSDEWRARSQHNIKQGAQVTIEKIQGTTMWVKPQDSQ